MPRLPRGKGFVWQKLFMVLIFATVILYGYSAFTEKVDEEITFVEPEEKQILNIFKILVVGAVTFGGYALFMKLSGAAMTKKDAFALILIGIFIWFLWDKFLVNILNSNTISDISFGTAQKLGYLKP